MAANSTGQYINFRTGSTGCYDDWWYTNEDGVEVNAVDLGEVAEIYEIKEVTDEVR